MTAIAEGNDRRKRRSRVPSGPAGARLVLDELLRRGFVAELAGSCTKKYDVLVGQCGWPKKAGSCASRACGSMVCPHFPFCWSRSKSSHGLRSPWPRKRSELRSFLRHQEQRHGDRAPSAAILA